MLFSLAILFLFIEIFLIPGFGVIGITGICMLFLSIFSFFYPQFQMAQIFDLILAQIEWCLIGLVILSFLVYRFRNSVLKYIFYKNPFVLKDKEFFKGDEEPFLVPGMVAITKTPLRPSGKIEVLGKIYDAISEGLYVPEGRTVKIIRIEGSKIMISEV